MKKIVFSLIIGIFALWIVTPSASANEIVVKKGDNLWSLANEYDTSVENLIEINNLESTMIYPNQILHTAVHHIVQKGDTLWGLSQAYGTTIQALKEWNQLSSDTIYVGEKLVVRKNGRKEVQEAFLNTSPEPVAAIEQEPQKKKIENSVEKTEELNKQNQSNENNHQSSNENRSRLEKTNEKQNNYQNETSKTTTETSANITEQNPNQQPQGKTLSVKATAYTVESAGGSGITATGYNLKQNPNAKVIAVDPSVIPLGSKVYVEGYGYATAADTGGAIKGNKIDVYVPTHNEAKNWGVRNVNVTIIE